MPLATYEQARPWAKAIRDEVLARRMPKWHAARGYGDFANDPSLSPFEIGLIAAWADGGAPRNTPGKVPAGTDPTRSAVSPGARGMASPPASREVALPCGDQPVTGRLLAVRPRLADGGSARIAAFLPDGRREIVAWIRDYDTEFPVAYWLRRPIDFPPGSRLAVRSDTECSVIVSLARH